MFKDQREGAGSDSKNDREEVTDEPQERQEGRILYVYIYELVTYKRFHVIYLKRSDNDWFGLHNGNSEGGKGSTA